MTLSAKLDVDLKEVRRRIQAFVVELDERELLEAVGLRHLKWVNDNFRREGLEKKWRPLSPNTTAKPGRGGISAKILRDTGRLAQSFTSKVEGNSVVVGSADKRAEWHHFGTRPFVIRPKNKGVLFFHTKAGPTFARIVNHPGITARKLLPSNRLGQFLADQVINAAVKRVVEKTFGRD